MNIPEKYIKHFPAYEDVFVGDLEHYRKHFLPICSINLQFLFPEQDEWLHFVSVKEIHESSVGEDTQSFHTTFTKEDMLGFDVMDGKYKFEADWDYFILHQKEQLEAAYETLKSTGDKAYLRMKRKVMSLDEVEHAYIANEQDYQSRKAFFLKNNNIYPYSSFGDAKESVEELTRDFEDKQSSGWGLSFPEVNGILDDIAFQSEEAQSYIKEYGESIEEMLQFEHTNLLYVPKCANGETFTYIGSFTGYYFQAFGADSVYLFYDRELRKAVICFEYS
ncbi:siderophore biosynthesis protein [Paenibacillus terrae]|uniref:siderophore biosynthesis protein n=1 Tax=Paenibacillus terrae TaxID=159743 RepID=UPI0011EB05F5|nr:siderophore biosynthesis protein [Paenibacillus terrae]